MGEPNDGLTWRQVWERFCRMFKANPPMCGRCAEPLVRVFAVDHGGGYEFHTCEECGRDFWL